MAAITIFSDFGAQENQVCHCFYYFSIYLPSSDGTGCHDLRFWILSFKSAFSISSFTFINRLLSCSSLSAIRVVSSAYLRLLLFLSQSWFQLVLHPAQHFAWCTLHINWISKVIIYSLDVLIPQPEPVCCSTSGSNCCFLTCIQISQEAGKVVWYSYPLKNFLQFVVICDPMNCSPPGSSDHGISHARILE